MKPENHAIRQLEKQLEDAPPEVAVKIERVILGLQGVLLNKDNPEALALTLKLLAVDVAALDETTW